MASRTYDAIIIGTGQAGPTLASKFAANGYKTAIVEKGHFGGSCVNYGCTPTKTLVASARIAYLAREAARWGIHINGDVNVDWAGVMQRKDDVVLGSRNGLRGWLESLDNLDIIEGHASFVSPTEIEVNGEIIEGERFFINVGGRARIPDLGGLEQVNYMTNRDILKIDEVPDHLLIVGGSYIGLEFAQIFRRFGSEVTIIERQDRLISREDPDISAEIERIFTAEGINLRLQAECLSFERLPDGRIQATVECRLGGPPEVVGTHLLLATGRVPNSDGLNVDAAGIETDARGYIPVNDVLQTNQPHIFALGDVNGRGAFTHTAYNDHEIVDNHFFGDGTRRLSDRFETYGLFIDPPLGRVGMSETQARASGRPLLIGSKPMAHISRANERGETFGLMKFIIDAETEQFLGAAVLGIGGDEIVHSITDQMYAGAPYTVIRDAVHIHPTVSELIPTTLQQLERVELPINE